MTKQNDWKDKVKKDKEEAERIAKKYNVTKLPIPRPPIQPTEHQ